MSTEPRSTEEMLSEREVLMYKVDVILDADTAHPELIQSEDGKEVRNGGIRQNVPDNPDRFDNCPGVLGKEGFSSGRFYFEVQVKDKTRWAVGVARHSFKGVVHVCPSSGYWMIWLRDGKYKALIGNPGNPHESLSLSHKPQKVGVFVDNEEGRVSFYDADHKSHIYSFTGQNFDEKLYPFICPMHIDGGKNSAPLIITPVC